MSVVIHKHLYCDGECEEPFDPSIDGRDDIRDQRAKAREQGWVRVKWRGKMIDLCYLCKDTHPSRKAPQ